MSTGDLLICVGQIELDRQQDEWHAQTGAKRKDGRGGFQCWLSFFRHR